MLCKLGGRVLVFLLLFKLEGNLLRGGSWWGDFNLHLRVTLHLYLLQAHLCAVLEVHVELSVTDRDLAHQTVLSVSCLLGAGTVSKTETQVVLNDDGLAELLAADSEVVNTNHRVIVGVHECRLLGNALDLSVFNVNQGAGEGLLIQHILHDDDGNCVGIGRVSLLILIFALLGRGWGLLLSIQSGVKSSLWNLLLLNQLISKDGQPVLEIRHDSVGCTPQFLTIGIICLQRELPRVDRFEFAVVRLATVTDFDLVEKCNEEGVSTWVVN